MAQVLRIREWMSTPTGSRTPRAQKTSTTRCRRRTRTATGRYSRHAGKFPNRPLPGAAAAGRPSNRRSSKLVPTLTDDRKGPARSEPMQRDLEMQ